MVDFCIAKIIELTIPPSLRDTSLYTREAFGVERKQGSRHKAERSALCWDRGRATKQMKFLRIAKMELSEVCEDGSYG